MQFLNTEICDQEELGKCITVEQRMKLVSCPRLDAIARENYYVDGEVDSNLEEVINLKNKVIAAQADVPSAESKIKEEEAEEDVEEEGQKPAAKTIVKIPTIERVGSENSTIVGVVTGINQPLLGTRYSIFKAWPLYTTDHVLKKEGTFKFLFPQLECNMLHYMVYMAIAPPKVPMEVPIILFQYHTYFYLILLVRVKKFSLSTNGGLQTATAAPQHPLHMYYG